MAELPDWRRRAHQKVVRNIQTWSHVRDLLGWDEDRFRKVAARAGAMYRSFEFRKSGTQKWRRIDEPQGELRRLQSAIQRRILREAPAIPDYVVGGIPGRSIIDNAAFHERAPVVVTIDIRACFPSIDNSDVYRVFADHLGYHPAIASEFTRATTFERKLPQGAPTSTMLANLALLPMLDRLSELAEERLLNFSAWIDDLTFSGRAARDVIDDAIEIVRVAGFSVSSKKVKVMVRHREAEIVTGAVVNTAVTNGLMVREVERELVVLAGRGVVTEQQLRSLRGKIAHCRRLRLPQGQRLERAAERLLSRVIVLEGGPCPHLLEYRPYRRPKRRQRAACRATRRPPMAAMSGPQLELPLQGVV